LIAEHLANLYQLQPNVTVGDMHPSFNATEYSPFASSTHTQQVQHHHAHMAACMADNGLSEPSGKTLGVIFDGAGFGADGTIWGGEFLYGDYAQVVRVAHLRHIPLIGGDAAVYEPVRTAFALVKNSDSTNLVHHCESIASLCTLSATQRNVFAHMMDKQLNTFLASSVGRLFDGVAALLGICTHAEYEAQGPIELEGLLQRDLTMVAGYEFGFEIFAHAPAVIDYAPVIRAIIDDIQAGIQIATISRKFHSGVVQMVLRVCQDLHANHPFNQVVLSGGVFLNEFLCVNTLIALRQAGITAYAHKNVPSNDGGISLGQVMVARARQMV
jgi:hydrogenase maturation protein HypF